MRSKTFMSKIYLQCGKLTAENRKSREKKRICSEVSVNSPGNPWRSIVASMALDLSAIVEFLFGIARVVALLFSLGNDICG